MLTRVEREVVALHEFFVDWFNGRCPSDDATFEAGLGSRLTEGFFYLMPGGERFTKQRLFDALRPVHGSNPDFRIRIRNVEVHLENAQCVVATYEELQRGARASAWSENARCTTVIFRREGDRLLWQHLHETWLPEAIRDAGPYDF